MPETITYSTDDFNDTTGSAFLLAVLDFAERLGFFGPFSQLSVKMKEVRYTQLQKVQTLLASILVGCKFTNEINQRLVPDLAAAAQLGMERFPDQSQINRWLTRLTEKNIGQLGAINAELLWRHGRARSRRGRVVVDFDQSGLVATGKTFELAEKGYFPRKRSRRGYQLSVAFVGGEDAEVLGTFLDPGNAHSSSRFGDLLRATEVQLDRARRQGRLWLRADLAYSGIDNLRPLVRGGIHFVMKGAGLKEEILERMAATVPIDRWQPVNETVIGAELGTLEELPGVRVVLYEVLTSHGEIKRSRLLTDLPPSQMSAAQLFEFYNGRQTIEAFFRESRHVYGMKNLRSRRFLAIYGFLWLVMMAHNLAMWAKWALFGGTELVRVKTRELIEKVGAIPARVVRHGKKLELILPSANRLAQLMVQALSIRQLPLPLLEPCLHKR